MGIFSCENEELAREVVIGIGVLELVFAVSPLNIGVGLSGGLRISEIDEEPLVVSVFVLHILVVV